MHKCKINNCSFLLGLGVELYLQCQHLEAKVRSPQVQGKPGQQLLGYSEKEAGVLPRSAKHPQGTVELLGFGGSQLCQMMFCWAHRWKDVFWCRHKKKHTKKPLVVFWWLLAASVDLDGLAEWGQLILTHEVFCWRKIFTSLREAQQRTSHGIPVGPGRSCWLLLIHRRSGYSCWVMPLLLIPVCHPDYWTGLLVSWQLEIESPQGTTSKLHTGGPLGFLWIDLPMLICVNWTDYNLTTQIGFAPKKYF